MLALLAHMATAIMAAKGPAVNGVGNEAARAADVPILMYHHVGELAADAPAVVRRFTVTPEQFERQMAWLEEHGYVSIDLETLAGHLATGAPMLSQSQAASGGRPVIVTFDDGWAAQYGVARPILNRHHLTATFFVYTGAIGEHPGTHLSWGQLAAMRDEGHRIESHTLNHPTLTETSDAELARQLVDSRAALDDRLGGSHTALAYPFGAWSERVVVAASAAGYRVAVGTEDRAHHRASEIMRLGRLTLTSEDTIERFAAMVRGEVRAMPPTPATR